MREGMTPLPRILLPIDQALAILAETPRRLAVLTDGVAPAQLHAAPAPDEWSANEVLAHLRACADVWGGSIARLLAEDNPTVRAVNPKTWIKQTNYPDLDFHTSLRAFSEQRASLLPTLERLSPDDWARSGTFTGAGAPLQRTVRSFAERLARHERPHIKQIERIVAAVRG